MASAPDPMQLDEVGRLIALLESRPPFERDGAPEPTVLAFVVRLCHPFSIGDVWNASETMGLHAGPARWPQLHETVANALAARFTDEEFAAGGYWADPVEVGVRRAIATGVVPGEDLWARVDGLDDTVRRHELRLRLAVLDPAHEGVGALLDDVDAAWIDPEAARCFVVASRMHNREVDVDGLIESQVDPAGAAHVLPSIDDPDRRTAIADRLLTAAIAMSSPDWWTALLVSRIGRFVSAAPSSIPVFDEDIWGPLIRSLVRQPATSHPDDEVRRAHPYAAWFDTIEFPHEVTDGVGDRVVTRWGGAPPEAAAPDVGDETTPELPSVEADGEPAQVTSPPIQPSDPTEVGIEPPATAVPPAGPASRPSPDDEASPPVDEPGDGVGRTGSDSGGRFFDRIFGRRRSGRGSGVPRGDAATDDAEDAERAGGDEVPMRDERRLGLDLHIGTERASLPVAAGSDVVVEVSIATDARFQVARRAGIGFGPAQQFRDLPVRIVTADLDQESIMRLPAAPTQRGQVGFVVRAALPELAGTVIVYTEDRSVVLAAAAFRFRVDDGTDPRPRSDDAQLVAVDAAALGHGPRATSANIVANGSSLIASAPEVAIPSQTTAVGAHVAQIVNGMQTAAGRFFEAEVAPDETIRALARVGAQMYTELGLDALAGHDRVQMVTVDPQLVFPLDLVYDRPEPSVDAVLCPDWSAALTAGECHRCPQLDDADQRRFVCPLGFWGMSKVIEHHRPGAGTSTFVARVHVGDDRDQLMDASRLVVGASELVGRIADDALDSTVTVAEQFGDVTVAADWTAWKAAIGGRPGVLLALPHHATVVEGFISRSALELGGSLAPSIAEDHVRPSGAVPGPLVLLLGCNTGLAHVQLLSFASSFRQFAPVVVATLGEVIVAEAPIVATAILEALRNPVDAVSVGEALREARRELLAQRRLVAFQLVLHGDGDWRLAS